ncbi:cation:proton antiporter [Asticcacaulis solisilvae]|uniref:cation:proton antiporter n=1 Tax=Asticcacaulis solisilvae TaxID=1217274 RepID=UPI003FD8DCFD
MEIWQILAVMIAAIGLTIVADKRNIPAPVLLAAVGMAASFLPGAPRSQIPPETLLGIVLPPLLYSAAADFSVVSFLRHIRSILNLGVAMVLAGAFAVALLIHMLIPGVPFAVALMLGAVVAPPDAVSAVAIGTRLGLPQRVMTILKGESLINDAAALTLFSVAAAWAAQTHTFIDNGFLYFLYAAGIGLGVGIGLGLTVHLIRRKLSQSALTTALAFITPFAAYSLADTAHGSGVIAVVFAGFTLGHKAGEIDFSGRIQEREVWRAADTLLEAFVFAYIGLRFRIVVEDAFHSGFHAGVLLAAGLAVIGLLIAVRFAWIFLSGALAGHTARLTLRKDDDRRVLNAKENMVLSWAGMRGVLTLAAAAGAPMLTAAGDAVPGRSVLVPIAFGVALGTLLLHGVTMPWLVRRLDLDTGDETRARRDEIVRARRIIQETTARAIEDLRGDVIDDIEAKRVAKWLKAVQKQTDPHIDDPEQLGRLVEAANKVVAAQREALIEQRDAEALNDEVLREVLEDLDAEQAVITARDEKGNEP